VRYRAAGVDERGSRAEACAEAEDCEEEVTWIGLLLVVIVIIVLLRYL
jgi:hypothetical protein